MAGNITCPKCGSERFFYAQETTEYHFIEHIEEDFVDLGGLDEAVNHDGYTLFCDGCNWEGDTEQYFLLKQENPNG